MNESPNNALAGATHPPIVFDLSETGQGLQLEGFSGVEPIGRWTDNPTARIILPMTGNWPATILFEIDVWPCVSPKSHLQTVEIFVNGIKKEEREFTRHFSQNILKFSVFLQNEERGAPLILGFGIKEPVQPSFYNMANDDRHLGIMIRKIKLSAIETTSQKRGASPYKNLPSYQFWRRAIASVETHLVDPVTHPRFKVSCNSRVGTAGSCFAQHISRRIMQAGFNYFVTETGSELDEQTRISNNYGTFSARYGNIYTTVQLLQLFDEAFGARAPSEQVWCRPDGRYVDPYRQQIQPAGFDTAEAVLTDRRKHLSAVRQLFEDVDIFVFTLGLTEGWRSKDDGSFFSAAPGVVAGIHDAQRYEFVNLTVEETFGALNEFLIKFHKLNPSAKVLLTVSPVPLIATYEPRSVLVSTIYSKSVLRVAAEMAIKAFDWVDYFSSYEIITGSFSGGLYYESDWREVNALGVSHAMRCFMNNYIEGRKNSLANIPPEALLNASVSGIICDEEAMDSVRN